MTLFLWIIFGGTAMSAIALVGSVTLLLSESTLRRVILPLVAFAAGSLIGGAFFHMIPAALATMSDALAVFVWVALGFLVFFALEQFLHYHHCHRATADCRQPLTYLILVGDALHNFLGGLAVASAIISDLRLGAITWLAAAAHEVPQELGDFGVLVHGGWKKTTALLFNLLSASTFLAGSILAYLVSFQAEIFFLVPFAAGNFLYIGASDLVPEINKHRELSTNLWLFGAFALGLATLLLVRTVLDG